jgi:uncharacterized protein
MDTAIKQTLAGQAAIDWSAQQHRRLLPGASTLNPPTSLAARRHAHASRCNGIAAPHIASCHVATDTPSPYIAHLCHQFEHKLAVSYDAQQGRIGFDFGLCLLHTDATGLRITALSDNRKDLDKLKHAIGSHFERFVWQAPLQLDWQTPDALSSSKA